MVINMFETIINHATDFLSFLDEFSDMVIWFFFSPFADVLDRFSSILTTPTLTLIATAMRTLGFEDVTLFSLMLTVGVGTYLIYQFAKWMIDILP